MSCKFVILILKRGKMLSYDLFSGVGGHALALRGAVEPVLFCDISKFCRDAVARRFPGVPIHDDVRTLTIGRAKPVVVTASFPCQDISAAGSRTGINGARSRLVFEVFRIVDADLSRTVRVLFFENSPMIRTMGLARIVRECNKRGFSSMAWTYMNAADVGAAHRRARWFFMAVRGRDSDAPMNIPRVPHRHVARLCHRLRIGPDDVPRLVVRESMPIVNNQRARMSALGNAVVPACVAVAWNILADALCRPTTLTTNAYDKILTRDVTVHVRDARSGHVSETKMEGSAWLSPRPKLEFVDGAVCDYEAQAWTTPVQRPATLLPTNAFSGRYRRMLATQVFYERTTQRAFRYRDVRKAKHQWALNPEWVESLMGFPRGWTA